MTNTLFAKLALVASVAVGLTAVAAAPAVAVTPTPAVVSPAGDDDDDDWERLWDFDNEDVCEAAGHAGEVFGLWEEDEWYCDDDGTLYVDR
ncbi:hypothetical protein WEI85_43695 [Actinomycetes bacterium KLBMP 9797]